VNGHRRIALATILAVVAAAPIRAGDEFLAALDGVEPYAVGRDAPRLETPQWVGEPGVEAVVVLAIDDLRDNPAKYEQFLRPILDRLKAIDGRAALSVMTNRIAPADPIAARWLAEGVNLDVHTLTHPCPLLQKGDFAAAAGTYHGGVDLLATVPGNRPLAFRMPCCDSQNTPSPRFYAELFNRPSPGGRFLAADSSVFCILTPSDPVLPRELVVDPDGRAKFRKYLPFPSFVNTIEDYPYPYVIGRLGWQFPCIVPSDWEAQNLRKPSNPHTVADMKAALDAVVIKRGVYCLVFHPHGWIDNGQVVELIDHAVARHGSKVKFLNFREAVERIEANATAGQPLRAPDGGDNGVRLVDLDADGSLDLTIGNAARQITRRWDRAAGRWIDGDFPTRLDGPRSGPIARGTLFGRASEGGPLILLRADDQARGAWAYRDGNWRADPALLAGLESADGRPIAFARDGRDAGARLRDLDGDGESELIAPDGGVFERTADGWRRLPFALPAGARIARPDGLDGGSRLVDLDRDGALDVIFADGHRSGAALFTDLADGWSRAVPGADDLPPIARADGTNNGFWLHSDTLWWQNEDTAGLPDKVDRRLLVALLAGVEPSPARPVGPCDRPPVPSVPGRSDGRRAAAARPRRRGPDRRPEGPVDH